MSAVSDYYIWKYIQERFNNCIFQSLSFLWHRRVIMLQQMDFLLKWALNLILMKNNNILKVASEMRGILKENKQFCAMFGKSLICIEIEYWMMSIRNQANWFISKFIGEYLSIKMKLINQSKDKMRKLISMIYIHSQREQKMI
jgi:hypothetical protein